MGFNDALCQMYYAKSGLARFIYKRLDAAKKKSEEKGVPDLTILFIFNMPFRSIGKMTGGVTDMNMVEGMLRIVNGHFFSGLGKIIGGYFKNASENKKYLKKIRG